MAWPKRSYFVWPKSTSIEFHPDIPMFPRSITDDLECVPCIIAKQERVSIRPIEKKTKQGTEIHIDMSGSVLPRRNGGNIFAINMLESQANLSEVSVVSPKSELPVLAPFIVNMVNNRFQIEGKNDTRIRYTNAKEIWNIISNAFARNKTSP